MKTFPSALIAAILALCLTPALAFAQTSDDLLGGKELIHTDYVKLNLIQSGDYVAPDGAGSLMTQDTSPLTATQEAQLVQKFIAACQNVPNNSSVKETSIDVSGLRISMSDAAKARMQEILSDVVNSNPSMFYVNGGLGFSWMSGSQFYSTISVQFDYNGAQIATMKTEYDKALNEALSWAPSDATKVQKAKAIHDWLVRNCSYNTEAAKPGVNPATFKGANGYAKTPWNAYGALVEKKPVCQGYSLAFSAAMSQLGITSTYVGQEISGQGGHGWNRISIDGTWYNLDVTFDDPTPDQGAKKTPSAKYFLKSDKWFKANPDKREFHTSWSPVGQPANDETYDSYAEFDSRWPTYSGPAGSGSSSGDNPGGSDNPGDQSGSGDSPSDPSSGQSGDDKSQGSAAKPTNEKVANPIVVKGKTIKVKFKDLKKKKKLVFKSTKAFKVSNAVGAVSYKKKFGVGKIAVAKNGQVTVKKGLKKGSYGVVVSVTADGSLTYASKAVTATVTIQVK